MFKVLAQILGVAAHPESGGFEITFEVMHSVNLLGCDLKGLEVVGCVAGDQLDSLANAIRLPRRRLDYEELVDHLGLEVVIQVIARPCEELAESWYHSPRNRLELVLGDIWPTPFGQEGLQ